MMFLQVGRMCLRVYRVQFLLLSVLVFVFNNRRKKGKRKWWGERESEYEYEYEYEELWCLFEGWIILKSV